MRIHIPTLRALFEHEGNAPCPELQRLLTEHQATLNAILAQLPESNVAQLIETGAVSEFTSHQPAA
jgi:hypothetical protein